MKRIFIIILIVFAGCAKNPGESQYSRPDQIVLVPAGEFQMGDNFYEGGANERPVHTVYLSAYYIGKYEVTNGEYRRFISDGGYVKSEYWTAGGFQEVGDVPLYWNDLLYRGGGLSDNEEFPVVGVNRYEAMAYCNWLSETFGKTYRLPTEAEWEKAARGTDQRKYSWGNTIDGSNANYRESGDPYSEGLTPVGFFNGTIRNGFQTTKSPSPYGAFDMSGNVWEWCLDYYNETYYQECAIDGVVLNPTGPSSGSIRVVRGGSWIYGTDLQRSTFRNSYNPLLRNANIGFRWVREK